VPCTAYNIYGAHGQIKCDTEPVWKSLARKFWVFCRDEGGEPREQSVGERGVRHAQCLLDAINLRACIPGMEAIRTGTFSKAQCQSIFGTNFPQDGIYGFAQLTELNVTAPYDPDQLEIVTVGNNPIKYTPPAWTEVSTFLARCNQLEILKLHLTEKKWDPIMMRSAHNREDILSWLPEFHLPRLQYLSLSGLVSGVSLQRLLQRHASTLWRLDIRDCKLVKDTGTWKQVLTFMSKLSLRAFIFHGLYDQKWYLENARLDVDQKQRFPEIVMSNNLLSMEGADITDVRASLAYLDSHEPIEQQEWSERIDYMQHLRW